jgi:tetratricopeptide (TPR) repeat protein
VVSDQRARLRFLLRLLLLLALVSAGVNYRRWQRAHRSVAPAASPAGMGRGGTGEPAGLTTSPAGPSLEQQWQGTTTKPGDLSAGIAQARSLFIAGHFGAAEAQLKQLKSRLPKVSDIRYWLSLAQRQEGHMDAALGSIQEAIRLEPRSQLFQEWEGEIYLAQGRSEEAATAFDVCLKRQPGAYSALLGKAQAMEQLYAAKRPVAIPEIIGPVEKAVRLRPQIPAGVTMLARMVLLYLQQFERAEQLAHQAIQLDPNRAEPYLILTESYLCHPDPTSLEQAVQCAHAAARLDPQRPEPLYLLGRVLLRQNNLPAAIEAFEQSTQLQMMPEAVYQLSLAYARIGDQERARHYSRLYESWNQFVERRKLLLALLQHRPQDINLYAQLGDLYLSQGAVEPARNWAHKGLQISPQEPRLLRILARTSAPVAAPVPSDGRAPADRIVPSDSSAAKSPATGNPP